MLREAERLALRRRRTTSALMRIVAGQPLPTGATFTGPSGRKYLDANGVLRSAALNAVRGAPGSIAYIASTPVILLEGASTNKTLQNGDLTNAAWTTSNATAALDGTVLAPDGTSSTKVTAGASAASRLLLGAAPITEVANTVVCFSMLLKQGTARYAQLLIATAGSAFYANFDLSLGTVTASGINTAGVFTRAGTIDMGNGWYRCYIVGSTTGTSYNQELNIVGTGTSAFNAADGTTGSTLNAALPQYEVGVAPSSIIPTTTVAVTRAAETLSIPVAFPEQPLTIYAEYIDNGTQAAGSGLLALGNFLTKPSLMIYSGGPTPMDAQFHNGTAGQVSVAAATGIVPGDTVEVNATLTVAGIMQLRIARNAGAEIVGTTTAGQALGTGWGGSVLLLNDYDNGHKGFAAFQKLTIASGIHSLAEMRNL